MKSWKEGAAFVASSCGIVGLAMPLTPYPAIAQALQGQCRQVNQNTFIYRTRSQAEPLSALARSERVTLAEETPREGWIAVTSPTTGFVRTALLGNCTAESLSMPPELPIRPPFPRITSVTPGPILLRPSIPPPSARITAVTPGPIPPLPPIPPPSPRITAVTPAPILLRPSIRPPLPRITPVTPAPIPPLPPPNLSVSPVRQSSPVCRRVNYPGPEGMTVRSGPGVNFARVAGIFNNDLVTIEPGATQVDVEGRQWLKLISPVSGWSSNGFTNSSEGNFANCP